MKTYIVPVAVKKADGTQYWRVTAESPEDAIVQYNAGAGDVAWQEVEVTNLEKPCLDEVYECDGNEANE